MSTLWWYKILYPFLIFLTLFGVYWVKKVSFLPILAIFSPFFVILHFQNYFCHIKTFYLYFSLLFKLVDLVFCQFSCHFRHFSAFLGFFSRPRPPIWHYFDAILGHTFQKITIFQIFPIIFGHIYMVLGQRDVVLAKKKLGSAS